MSADTFVQIAEEIAQWEPKPMVRFIRFGEPTLHEEWPLIVRVLHESGIKTHMNTNGLCLNAQEMLDSGLDSLKISIHGLGSWRAAQEMIEARGDAEKPFITIAYLSTEQQFDDLPGADKVTFYETKDLSQERTEYCDCYEVWNKLSVDWDGSIQACCGSWDRHMTVGNLAWCSLKDAWKSSALQRFRNMLKHKRHKELTLCSRCARSKGGDL